MEYNASTNQSAEKHEEFIAWLTDTTLQEFRSVQGDSHKLRNAVQQFITKALAAKLELEEMENILGVNEPCIMDLAELSEDDEEIVIDAYEHFTTLN